MLDVLAELKKYQKIDLTKQNDRDLPGLRGTAFGGMSIGIGHFSRIAEDINKMSKKQFRMEQQMEDCFEEIEEITRMLQQELDMAKTYQKSLENKDDLIKEIKIKSAEQEENIQSLVLALISFVDNIDLIYAAILSSGDEEWLRQMNRVKNYLSLVLRGNKLYEIGQEKYFNDQLHDVGSLVEDENRGFREITGVEQKGYLYQGNIIRKARVIVNNYKNYDDYQSVNNDKDAINDRNNDTEDHCENAGDEQHE